MAKRLKVRGFILAAGFALYIGVIAAVNRYMLPDNVKFLMYLVAYFTIGFESFRQISRNIGERKILDEHLLMIAATVGALAVGHYMEGVAAMLLFQIGCILEAASVDQTKRTIAKFIDIRPVSATKKDGEQEVQVQPEELELKDVIIIKQGERVPVDARVITGNTSLDTKALTGEAMPDAVGPGDIVYSGSINLTGVIEAEVLKIYKDSTVSRVMALVEEAQNQQAERENFVRKFASFYTPLVILAALVVMVVFPMVFAWANPDTWVYRGMIMLIAACPSAIILSVPVAFLGGIASAARQGIVVKGGNYLELLARADTFVFDKTGTLTEGRFQVTEVRSEALSREELLEIAAHVENYSNHPIAQSLMNAYGGEYDPERVEQIKERPGYGISATYKGVRVHIGNLRMAEKYDVKVDKVKTTGTVIYVIASKQYAGYIIIEDKIREDARWTLRVLREKYKAVLVMLTGDSKAAGRAVARQLKMDYAYTELMPEEKLEQMEEFMLGQDEAEKIVCVGDGINDAPVLARADVGIAMGGLGSDAAVEAADIVLMEDELTKIVDAIRIAKETMSIVEWNVHFSIAMKFLVLFLAVIGYITMWEAVFIDMGVVVISIINAAGVVRYSSS